MKLKRLILAALAVTATLAMPLAASAGVNDFMFPSFDADYYLTRDAQQGSHLRVIEHLTAQFPEFDQNHGILRAIPESYQGHNVNLHIDSVTDANNDKLQYSTSHSNGNLVLKIGNPDAYVHGSQAYVISYTQDDVTVNQPGYDGHFWDVNGDQWSQEFGEVTARVHLPADLAAALQPTGTRCYAGSAGDNTSICNISPEPGVDRPTNITFTTTRALPPGETLTYELRFASGTFAPYRLTPARLLKILGPIILLYVLPALAAILIMLRQWRRYGRDPRGRGVIIPEYTPPQDLSLVAAGVLLTEKFKPSYISAQLIDLTVRGYCRVYETKTDRVLLPDKTAYDIKLVKAPDSLRPDEKSVLELVFGTGAATGTRVSLDSLKNTLYSGAKIIGQTAGKDMVTSGLFRTDPLKAAIPYITVGVILAAAGFYLGGFTRGLILPGLIVILFGTLMPARTPAGVEKRDYLLGLKMFISVTEAERIKALQSPRGDLTEKIDTNDPSKLVKLYEKLLPYAMLFGIEKEWAEQFAQLYQTPPDWYSGSSAFNAAYFAGSLSNFTNNSTASFTPPSSSGSGGFAGGGGGGGGGGGW
jgi:uncharacterized membrane protein YgcG